MSNKPDPTTVRVDKWLWSVRIFKTRSSAGDACTGGKVTVNDDPVKSARKLKIGDSIDVRHRDFTGTYVVQRLIEKRVGAAVAAECYLDMTPERPKKERHDVPLYAVRERGAGRPTKRDRRQLDRLRSKHDDLL